MKIFFLIFFPLSTFASTLPLEFRQVIHDRIEEYAPGSYKHLLDLHGNAGGSLSLVELVQFLSLLQDAHVKFNRGIKPIKRLTKVANVAKVNYNRNDPWISRIRLF